jgi:hypothetical protein
VVFGEQAEAAAASCCQEGDDALEGEPAVHLDDQSKAFERVGHLWLLLVLQAWRMPLWCIRSFLGLCMLRLVQACILGRLGPLRLVRRSIGMGGPASPFLWCLAFDPIVVAVAMTVGLVPPTYVDDLAALAFGPAQVRRAQLFLVAVGSVAGLATEMHHCEVLFAPWGRALADVALRPLPGRTAPWGGGADAFRVVGLPGATALAFLAQALGPAWAAAAFVRRSPCRCKVKAAVVPGRDIARWRAALRSSVHGA